MNPVQARLPCSSKRGDTYAYAKLIRRVLPGASSGFDYWGTFLKPGAMVFWRELRPEIEYPEVPLLLECAGISKAGRGHNRSELLYILWQWCVVRRQFVELARAVSHSWDWAVDLAAPARRAIEDGIEQPDLIQVRRRVRSYLSLELDRVSGEDRARVLGVVHDEIAALLFFPGRDLRAIQASE